MKIRILLLFFLCCTSLSLSAQQGSVVEFYTTTLSGNPGDTVCLPIKVRDFDNLLSSQMGFRWNADALQFLEARLDGYSLPDNGPANFNFLNTDEGTIQWVWYTDDLQPLSIEDNATLFELCFVLSDTSAGGFYSFSFDSGFTPPEVVYSVDGGDLELVPANFTPGGIFIQSPGSSLQVEPIFDFNIDCGFYNAIITAFVQGGQPPYRYSWSGPQSIFSTAGSIKAVREGLYYLSVKDQTGVEVTAEILVDFMRNNEGFEKPEVSATVTEPDCGVANGQIDINVSTPQPDGLRYFWSTGATTPNLDSIPAGTYTLVVSSTQNICTDTLRFMLSSQGDIALDTIQEALNCAVDAATIGVQVGNGDFNYNWNTGETTSTIEVTTAGNYELTVTDGSCLEILSFEVVNESNPPNPTNFIVEENNLACDDTTATIGVTYFGLRPDIQYLWSTGETTSKIDVNDIGEYTLTVLGGSGCSIDFTFTVLQDDPDLPFEQEITFQGCAVGQTRLSMLPLDGRSYDFIWSTAETTSSVLIDQPGTYTVTVTEPLSTCAQVFVFDEEAIGDPTKGVISLNIDCGIEEDCYSGTTIDISIDGAAEPLQYTWSDGTSVSGNATTTLNIYSQQNLDLYIQDADGCTDTLRNLLADCQTDLSTVAIKARQYIVCETDPETSETITYVYNEVLNGAGAPPYVFFWGNGFVDTSYFRSRQPIDSLSNLFISITDQVGNRFDRQLMELPENYACGDEMTPVFSASDTIVTPGTNFRYPIYIENHMGLERAVYTIDWDPCLITVDSILFYNNDGLIQVERNIFSGTFEAFFHQEGGSTTGANSLLAELHCRANNNVEGVSPFLFSINEAATDANDSTILVRPQHSSITISDGTDIVQPGDANLNGLVNHKDLLNMGLAFGEQGPDRRTEQVQHPDYAYSWLRSTPASSVDLKYIDGNGDGLINAFDRTAIDQHFEYVPSPERGTAQDGEVPLFFTADTLYIGQRASFAVSLGSQEMPVMDAYGLAFSLRYDPAVIDEQSIALDFSESWLTNNATPLSYFRVDTENQLVHIAISRTDQQNISGNGAIVQVSFDVIAADTLATTFQTTDALLIAADETRIPVLTSMTEASVQIPTSTNNIDALSQELRVFPNPVQDKLFLETTKLDLQTYRLYDNQGRQIKGGPIMRPILDLSSLPQGVYLLQIQTDQGLVRKQLVVQGSKY